LSAPVHVIHENPDWFAPFAQAFQHAGIPVREWLVTDDSALELDLASAPPQGVFWSRLSASAHTRGNSHSTDRGRALLGWIEAAGRRTVNGTRALELEVSKAAQHRALSAHGFDVPETIAVLGRAGIARAARKFPAPFIVKHNQGGRGLGVHRFDSHGELEYHLAALDELEEPADGVTLVQEYLAPRDASITRVEFVGARFVYAVGVDVTAGAFQLCPAEQAVGRQSDGSRFSLRTDLEDHPIISRYERFLASAGIDIAGIEFIETDDGRLVTYDVNTTTNYHPAVEAAAAQNATGSLTAFFSALVTGDRVRRPVAV
jgi:glutathione synthase/RimK-type ligase-like ATP-grasp enzyme